MMETLQTPDISVLEPIGAAVKKTRQILFCPFSIEKWLVLGFCAWLAGLGGGGGFNFNLLGRNVGATPEFDRFFHEVKIFIAQHLPLVALIGIGAVLLLVVIGLLALWLKSRGLFMFIDGIARNRAAVSEPWTAYRAEANALFGFKLIVWLTGFAAAIAMLIPLCMIAFTFIQTQFKIFYAGRAMVFFLLLFALLLMGLVYGLIVLLTDDFVVPVMYLRRCGVRAAWKECIGLLKSRLGAFVLYTVILVAANIVLGLITALGAMLACCCLCCVAWVFLIPLAGGYLFTVFILPLRVWRRSYALYFLAQFGGSYNVFEPVMEWIAPVSAADVTPPPSEGENI